MNKESGLNPTPSHQITYITHYKTVYFVNGPKEPSHMSLDAINVKQLDTIMGYTAAVQRTGAFIPRT